MKCKFCKRELKSVTAVKLGYGPVCAKKNTLKIKLQPEDYRTVNFISYCNTCKMDTDTEGENRCEICEMVKG